MLYTVWDVEKWGDDLYKLHKDAFDSRQTMQGSAFEFHHYLDPEPPEVPFHAHPFYEVYFFLSGVGTYCIEGRVYQMRPGDILLTGNRDIHRPNMLPGKPYERYVLWLTEDFLTQLRRHGEDLGTCFHDAAKKGYHLIRPDVPMFAQLKSQCALMAAIKDDHSFGSGNLFYANLITFLVYLNRAYADTAFSVREDIQQNKTINRLLAYINNHLTEPLSLDGLSSEFYLSKFYLNNKFKRYTGLTLYQYIIKKRLTVARNLLRTGTPVMNAYIACGFSDYSNFLKAFKREFGCTPRDYSPTA